MFSALTDFTQAAIACDADVCTVASCQMRGLQWPPIFYSLSKKFRTKSVGTTKSWLDWTEKSCIWMNLNVQFLYPDWYIVLVNFRLFFYTCKFKVKVLDTFMLIFLSEICSCLSKNAASCTLRPILLKPRRWCRCTYRLSRFTHSPDFQITLNLAFRFYFGLKTSFKINSIQRIMRIKSAK